MNSSSYAEDRTGSSLPLPGELQAPAGDDLRRSDGQEDVLGYYFKRIDPEVAASFTKEQRKALRAILAKRRIARLALTITLPRSLSDHDRKILETAGNACPVKQSLDPRTEVPIEYRYE